MPTITINLLDSAGLPAMTKVLSFKAFDGSVLSATAGTDSFSVTLDPQTYRVLIDGVDSGVDYTPRFDSAPATMPAHLGGGYYLMAHPRSISIDKRVTQPGSHTHQIGDVTGLQGALDGKASLTHNHQSIAHIGPVGSAYSTNTSTSLSTNRNTYAGNNQNAFASAYVNGYPSNFGNSWQSYQNGFGTEIFVGASGGTASGQTAVNGLWFRNLADWGSTWSAWSKVWTDKNFDPSTKVDKVTGRQLMPDPNGDSRYVLNGSGNWFQALGSDGLLRADLMPPLAIAETFTCSTQSAMLALTAQKGDICVRTDLGGTYILVSEPATTLANWTQILTPADGVQSINSKSGASITLDHADLFNLNADSTRLHVSQAEKDTWNAKESALSAGTTAQYYRGDKSWQTLNKTAVGLGNVDNTSDANKPISTATQTALDAKAPISHTHQEILRQDTRDTDTLPNSSQHIAYHFKSNSTNGLNDGGLFNKVLHLQGWVDNTGGKTHQLGFTDNGNLWMRSADSGGGAGTWGAWYKMWHSGNFDPSTKAPISHTHSSLVPENTNEINVNTSMAGSTLWWGYRGATNAITKHAFGQGKANAALARIDVADATESTNAVTKSQLDTKEPAITAGTNTQYYRGDKTWQTLDKTAVGLSNVNNTSDANKPISNATQSALDGKAPSTHTHTHNSLDGGVAIDYSVGNLDALTANGHYRGANMSGAPDAGWWWVESRRHTNDFWRLQVAYPFGAGAGNNSNNDIYWRKMSQDVWGAWQKFWTSGNFDPSTKANTAHNHDAAYVAKGGAGITTNFTVSTSTVVYTAQSSVTAQVSEKNGLRYLRITGTPDANGNLVAGPTDSYQQVGLMDITNWTTIWGAAVTGIFSVVGAYGSSTISALSGKYPRAAIAISVSSTGSVRLHANGTDGHRLIPSTEYQATIPLL